MRRIKSAVQNSYRTEPIEHNGTYFRINMHKIKVKSSTQLVVLLVMTDSRVQCSSLLEGQRTSPVWRCLYVHVAGMPKHTELCVFSHLFMYLQLHAFKLLDRQELGMIQELTQTCSTWVLNCRPSDQQTQHLYHWTTAALYLDWYMGQGGGR